MKKSYTYPAIFERAENGEIWARFPDVPRGVTSGASLPEARSMAAELLKLMLNTYFEKGEELPEPGSVPEEMPDPKNGWLEMVTVSYKNPKRGQPPKEPEDKRTPIKLLFSPKEKELIAQGMAAEETDEKFSTYVRNAALQRAEKALGDKEKEKSRLDVLESRIEALEKMVLK